VDDCNHKISIFHIFIYTPAGAEAAFADLLLPALTRVAQKENSKTFLSHQEQHQLVGTLNASHFQEG
jgi:hypothetical protein